jgi:uncharacterized sulfatase
MGAAAAGVAALGVLGATKAQADNSDTITITTSQPNILVIMVDQLRYEELKQHTSTSYPLAEILPNITALQQQSVEFQNYFTAGTSCTPARASLLTGLYSPQTCMYVTQGNDSAPNLVPTFGTTGSEVTGFPTFGSFLQSLTNLNSTFGTSLKNYSTAWFGKWHLSDESEDDNTMGLQKYGFSEKIIPSPNGYPNEGINGQSGAQPGDGSAVYDSDLDILNYFVKNMPQFISNTTPWLAVVSLINPHDISNYPQYGLNYCNLPSPVDQVTPNFEPLPPGSVIPVANDQIAPANDFPALPAVYNSSSTASNAGSCSSYSGFLPASAVTSSSFGSVPSNISDTISDKPPLQAIYQSDIASATQAGTAGLGDVGSFLNVYYWLASCVDQLIGSPAPNGEGVYSNTILGQLASMMNAAGQDLSNTVVIFLSDHGEYGGAHGLYGKGAANYDEAINVPLFVQIPGVTGNHIRSQMCSSVDFFGLIAALATNNALTSSNTPIWMNAAVNPQLAGREQLYAFIESATAPNARVLPGTFADVGGLAYVLHTTDEFWADESGAYDYAYGTGEAYHVVGLRTGAYMLATYTAWSVNQSTPGSINFSNVPATDIEFYDFSSNPTEIGNDYSNYLSEYPSFIAALQTAYSSVVTNELQAPLSTTFPSATYSLSNSQQTAAASYNAYIDPPTGVSLSVTSFVKNQQTQVTITGSNVQPGPIVKVLNAGGTVTLQRMQTPVGTESPFNVTLQFGTAGTYQVVVLNPSLAPSNQVTVTVSD